jgi:predicted DNA-binding transcriptional regulator YafY
MQDGPTRVERLLNLLACLLETRTPLPQEQLVRDVSGYPESRAASRRAFERDKEALRGMCVSIRVEPLPFGDGNEVGYRVDPADYYLADLDLTAEETAALNMAVSAVSLGDSAGHGALMKLGGLTGEAASPIASLPTAPALPALFDAFRRRAVVTFTYRGEPRVVEAWALSSKSGQWYLVGHDRRRDALRIFRADRIEGDVEVGAADAFSVPESFRAEEVLRDEPWTWGEGAPVTVELLVDRGREDAVLASVSDAVAAEERADGTLFHVPVVGRAAFRSFVLGFLEHAEVLGPPDVRADMTAWLERMAG